MLTVLEVAGPALVVDAGRPGRMHEGIPPGGPMVPELFAAANRAAGNAPDAPAIETFGRIAVALDDRRIEAVARAARVAYLAVPGGLDVPWVLGGRGTLLVAGLGGHEGRLLRRGDRIPVGAAAGAPEILDVDLAPGAPIRVVPGPDAPAPLGEHTISPVGDRTGIRLLGAVAAPPAPAGASAPMTCGAIQLPPSGEPIVLGPDCPTTGGYPVIAVVVAADRGRLFARRAGERVTFVAVTPPSATPRSARSRRPPSPPG
ncbi:MAG TPA: hypothetical protein VKE22_08435 [Haliangiales bacterium]|nr:hypothetical protein [Haliangiales bacterium]